MRRLFPPHPLVRSTLPALGTATLAIFGLGTQAAGLNDTGQIGCYNTVGAVVSLLK